MTNKTGLKYYSFGPVLSRNGVYNFIVGARGLGKTYGAKKKAVKDFLARGDQFIYLRRYDTELRAARDTLFADLIANNEFPDVAFRIKGNEGQIQRNKHSPWETCCFFVPLSKAQSKKSVSFPNVKTIIYDEFIIEKGSLHYLPNEAKAFNDFYSTVDRWQDKTRVLFLANSLTIMNPYFLEYDIRPKKDQEWITGYGGFVVAHFPNDAEFTSGVYKTRFGQFIKGTDYADYSVGSEFHDNTEQLIAKKTPEAKYMCSIETLAGTFSVWADVRQGYYYIQEKRPKEEWLWTMLPERMSEGKVYVTYTDRTIQRLRASFANGRIRFDTPQARNAFTGIFAR